MCVTMLSTSYRATSHCFMLDSCYLEMPQDNKSISVGERETVLDRFVSLSELDIRKNI